MIRRVVRGIRNVVDFFIAWILWGPTRVATALAVASGARAIILPRFAHRSFAGTVRLKFYRTAVEIFILSGISVPEKRIQFLLQRCMACGYAARASLLSPYIGKLGREKLYEWLILRDQVDLAHEVVRIDGGHVPESVMALAAQRYQEPNLRGKAYAQRLQDTTRTYH